MRKTLGIFGLLLVICVVTAVFNGLFAGGENVENLLRRTALFGFISIGAAFVIITGGIDLSIGSVIALTACLFQVFLTPSYETLSETYRVVEVREVVQTAEAKEYPIVVAGDATHLKQDDRLVIATASGKLNVRSVRRIAGTPTQTLINVRNLPTALAAEMSVGVESIRYMSVPLAILLVLLISLAIGVAHGLLITKVKLQPFVVTLCGLMIYRGLARFVANDQSLGFEFRFENLKYLVGGKPFSLPVPFLEWISTRKNHRRPGGRMDWDFRRRHDAIGRGGAGDRVFELLGLRPLFDGPRPQPRGRPL